MGYGPSRQMRGAGNHGEQLVQFKLADAQRIADAVGEIESARRGRTGSTLSRAAQVSSHYLSKTTAEWAKGSSQTLTLWTGTPGSEVASSGDTVVAWNKFAKVSSGKWVMLARANGSFYVIAAEC